MRSHLPNAAWGIIDYAAYPIAMLLATPMLLRHLGTTQYGIWAVCTAVVSSGGIIASGFGDANIQYVATQRMTGDTSAITRAVRSMIAINLAFGSAIMLFSLAFVPVLAHHITTADPSLYGPCVWSLRMSCVLMLVRALESVSISTQRAFEHYGRAIAISLALRILVIVLAAVIATFGYGVTGILVLTLTLTVLGTVAQFIHLKSLIDATTLWPAVDSESFKSLFGFGVFSCIQAFAAILFTQADRILAGAILGASAVTAYALCVQIAQPVYGLAAAGLHFLFPYLAGKNAVVSVPKLRRAILIAFAVNALFVLAASIAVFVAGRPFLSAWVGKELAVQANIVLSPIIWSFALLGLNVTGYYALLALGRVRLVTWINLLGGSLMLLSMLRLVPRYGIRGIAMSRLVYGILSLAIYFPLARILFPTSIKRLLLGTAQICEDV
jgi:O-antigen/teichoic acid export membrane protein